MSASNGVLTPPISVGCYDGTTIMDARGVLVATAESLSAASEIVALVNASASAYRAGLEAAAVRCEEYAGSGGGKSGQLLRTHPVAQDLAAAIRALAKEGER